MMITRIGRTEARDGLPVISRAVIRGDMIYLCGVTPDPVGDIRTQTRQVLQRIDALLQTAGSDKSQILQAIVWLSDMRLFSGHNTAWNEWVDAENPPARACLHSPQLWQAGMLVEIMVTAARNPPA